MTLAQLYTKLTATGIPTRYRAFPTSQSLPFICYLETMSHNTMADGKVYYNGKKINIELYVDSIESTYEATLETALSTAELPWEKSITYLESEKCYQIIYETEI